MKGGNLSGDTLKAYTLIEHLRGHFSDAEMTASDMSFGPPPLHRHLQSTALPTGTRQGRAAPITAGPGCADERSRVAGCQELPASTRRHLISRNRKYLPANQKLAPALGDKEVNPRGN